MTTLPLRFCAAACLAVLLLTACGRDAAPPPITPPAARGPLLLDDTAVQAFLPAGFALNACETASLSGRVPPEYLLISRSTTRGGTAALLPTVVTIVGHDTDGWRKLTELNLAFAEALSIHRGPLIDTRDAVIIATQAGSGGYLDYRLLAQVHDHLAELRARQALFQGQVRIRDRVLYETAHGSVRAFAWNGRELAERLLPDGRQPDEKPEDRIVTFRVRPDGSCDLRAETVTIAVGQRLRVRRAVPVPGESADRIIAGGDVLAWTDGFLVGRTAGTGVVEVIPGYYADTSVSFPVVVR